ncbi:hypothetical protein CNR22_15790 [Sphingobacteriaceae bacterium]|nr:hypothetical protein CNR22_15790 [Sphingobacteriaceae bacterium]
MFINLLEKPNFRELKISGVIALYLCLLANLADAQQIIRGTVFEGDSSSIMPFVYIINKSSGNGTMSDNDGRFTLATNPGDTLLCSYVGFLKLYIPVKDLQKNEKGEVKIFMSQMAINLGMVNITTFRYQPYEREYMNDIIDKSRIKAINYASSPITALYMRYSKEGKQIQKLAQIFDNLLMEEEVQRRLSREILVRLTGDKDVDYYAFRKYCYYVSDYFIVTHEGFDLYSKVMDCYKQFKADRGGYRLREEGVSPEKKKETARPNAANPDGNWKKREEVKPQE